MNVFLGMAFLFSLALFAATVFRDIGPAAILNPEALVIVCGGTFVAVFLAFPFSRLSDAIRDVIDAFRQRGGREELVREVVDVARLYRKTDIRGLEERMNKLQDDFLRLGVGLLISNQKSEQIRSVMERELAMKVMHRNLSMNVLKTVSRLTPSFGLAGTVISLIRMFRGMQSVESLAPLMGLAMMSTFYGVIIANLLMLPLCAKLKERVLLSEALMHIIIEGVEAINNMEHPLRIEERLSGHAEAGEPDPAGAAQLFTAVKDETAT